MSSTQTPSAAPQTHSATPAFTLLRRLSHVRWLEADSSAVAALAYDRELQTLYCQMRASAERIYAYAGVPESVFVELATAPSIGSYFARNIRDAYPTKRVDFAVSAVA